jgi:hypothetical protein
MPKAATDDSVKRKVRAKLGPGSTKPGPAKGSHTKKSASKAPKTSAQPVVKRTRDNLTLHDWLTVIGFVDEHPQMSQDAVVAHFNTLATGALLFTQGTLSRKLRPGTRAELERRTLETPNALLSKRPRVVTAPKVDRALFLWQKLMEAKSETTTGAMLVEKRRRFEEKFGILEEERLLGTGWIASWKNTCVQAAHQMHAMLTTP